MVEHAKIATLLLPGIGTVHDLKNACDAGVYSSFLRHSEVAAAKYGPKTVDLLVELGRSMVGGVEDMIAAVALDLLAQRC